MQSIHQATLFIRTDAGGAIGTGHVMRMFALAQSWVKNHESRILDNEKIPDDESRMTDGEGTESHPRVIFISAKLPEALAARLQKEGFTVARIDAEPGSEEDLRQTLDMIDNSGWRMANSEEGNPLSPLAKDSAAPDPWLVVDGYRFDYNYQKRVRDRSGLRLLCVDDHGYSDRWYCDAILNQNLDAEKRIDYQTELSGTKLLLGASFCLLRREFWQAPQPAKEWGRIQSLLVTLGGSDPDNATGAVLQLLHRACARPLDIRVLLGAVNPHLDTIQTFESHHRIEILQGASNMTAQYAWADGIISAGGSTCWEWLYFGLPGAIVTIAENQLPIVEALTESRRAALALGWIPERLPKEAGDRLADWLNSPGSVIAQAEALQLVDGRGAFRIAKWMSETKPKQIKRP